jgi:hypothetical protein
MTHALLQTHPTPPSAEQLAEAFRGIPGLTAVDAAKSARQAYGVLARNLTAEDATNVAKSLRGQGFEAIALAESQVPRLPEPKYTRRLDITPDALHVYDAIGRPQPVPWPQISLLSAGIVPRMNLVSFTTDEIKVSVGLTGHRRQEVVTQLNHKLDTSGQLVLDIILTGGSMRFQVESKEFLYKYTVDVPELEPNQRFGELVRRLLAHTPNVLLNRGAEQLRDNAPLPQVYISKAAFADESLWLLWRAAQPPPNLQP